MPPNHASIEPPVKAVARLLSSMPVEDGDEAELVALLVSA